MFLLNKRVSLLNWRNRKDKITILVNSKGYQKIAYDPCVARIGFYQVFLEGYFIIFFLKNGSRVVGWHKKLAYSEELSHVGWEVGTLGLTFRVTKKGGEVEIFQYKTLRCHPWWLITQLFFPDDDWDLAGDLPHYAYTRLSSRW